MMSRDCLFFGITPAADENCKRIIDATPNILLMMDFKTFRDMLLMFMAFFIIVTSPPLNSRAAEFHANNYRLDACAMSRRIYDAVGVIGTRFRPRRARNFETPHFYAVSTGRRLLAFHFMRFSASRPEEAAAEFEFCDEHIIIVIISLLATARPRQPFSLALLLQAAMPSDER